MTTPVQELLKTLHSLHRSMHRLDFTGDEECIEMSMLQMHTLLQIREQGSCSMKELAASQKIVPATMTALVDRLVRKELLERTVDEEDRRSIRVSLSRRGEELLQRFYKQKVEHVTMLLNILDLEEQETLVAIMKKIDKHFLTLIDRSI